MSKNQVFFSVSIVASLPAETNNENLALLQAHYKVNNFTTKVKDLRLQDSFTGAEIDNLTIHEFNVDWEDYIFDQDEE
ncbi:hypothetical protein [Priestia flexa]|uniref:hypothetical protein n=1 Tax=Priestia flexa TaxID=86664 RepID=UPI0004736384|nr:hypothetical protein [Priestia flexa]